MDKWKPQSAADLVGNGPNLQLMRQWLANWHRIHVLGGEAQAGPGARGAKMDMTKKALLISGAPGTGKTTASQILGRCVPRLPCAGLPRFAPCCSAAPRMLT